MPTPNPVASSGIGGYESSAIDPTGSETALVISTAPYTLCRYSKELRYLLLSANWKPARSEKVIFPPWKGIMVLPILALPPRTTTVLSLISTWKEEFSLFESMGA